MKLSTFEEVAQALDEAEVRFILVGGIAVKDEAGRPQDLADAAELRHLHRMEDV